MKTDLMKTYSMKTDLMKTYSMKTDLMKTYLMQDPFNDLSLYEGQLLEECFSKNASRILSDHLLRYGGHLEYCLMNYYITRVNFSKNASRILSDHLLRYGGHFMYLSVSWVICVSWCILSNLTCLNNPYVLVYLE